jgi:hypothetical protein
MALNSKYYDPYSKEFVMKTNKIQALLINHLAKYGTIQLALPDNMILEIGITAETDQGIEKIDDYCWVITKKEDRAACIDSYNLGIRFSEEDNNIVLEDSYTDVDGLQVRQLNVV